MFRKLYSVRALCCVIFLLVITGCSTNTSSETNTNSDNRFYNSSVARMPVKRYIAKHQYQIQQLNVSGVQVIQTGDDLMLVLPSDQFFVGKTPVLNMGYYSVLNNIADLLSDHEKISIKIAGYTDSMEWQPRNIALSRQQAEAIANYLWDQRIDTRTVYATGYGQKDSIASNQTEKGRMMNRRVEITLSWVTDPKQG